jgi:hypothetical protein
MKHNIFIVSCVVALLFAACENILETPVNFQVALQPSDATSTDSEGNITAPVGTSLTFDFSGDPDFISFSYELFDATRPLLSFTSALSWNKDEKQTLQLFLSETFAGLKLTDAAADAAAIQNHTWVNISSDCVFPTAQNASAQSSVYLDDYKGKEVVLAFRYKTTETTGFQPMWTVSDLKLDNISVKTALSLSNIQAAIMGFTPFDMNNISPDAYLSGTAGGVWDTSAPNALKIRQTPAGRALNEDWLISKPVLISEGRSENGTAVAVKNTTKEVNSYTHTFTETGIYTVTFTASNYNYAAHSSVEKTFIIVIE